MAKKGAPEGYKDEAEFLDEARRRYQEDESFDRLNREAALEDLKFLAGEQWDPDDIVARKGRPCLTINTLPQYVAQVVGDIRINRPAIKVRPAEDGDKKKAEVREGLIRAIERDSDASGVYATTGQAQVACGIGNFRVALEYAAEDSFDRVIAIRPIPNPFAVVWDCMSIDPTGRDAGHCFVTQEMPRKQFEKAYPDAVANELGPDVGGQLEAQGWMTKDVVRLTEYWLVKDKPVEIAMVMQPPETRPQTKELTDENRAELTPLILTNSAGQPMIRKTTRKSVCMYLITGHAILEDEVEYKLTRLPIIRAEGWVVQVGSRRDRWGLVRFAKDPARLKNYWRSVAAESLALAPRGKWLVQEQEAGRADDFRTSVDDGDAVLGYSGVTPPQWIPPPQPPVALLNEANLAQQDIKDVTGLHDASLGARSNETSGKAIRARQQEGDVANYVYHDNLQAAIAEGGKVVNQLIPVVYDTARIVRIIGEDDSTTPQTINVPDDPDSIDLGDERYDIVVETGPSYSTKRVEAAESMIEFARTNPAVMQVAGDLIAKAMDWPMADKLAERLKSIVPPQALKNDEDEQQQAPPPPSPEEQQAMELRRQADAMVLRRQSAETEQAVANAEKAKAEADEARSKATKAEMELAMMGVTVPPPPTPTPPPPGLQDFGPPGFAPPMDQAA